MLLKFSYSAKSGMHTKWNPWPTYFATAQKTFRRTAIVILTS